MRIDSEEYQYLLDNQFFANIDGEEIPKGKVNVNLLITKTAGYYNLDFVLNGTATIPCDRCLDDMDHPIDTTARLIVKLGRDYAEESDEVIVIPESEGTINLAWFLYEFVALAIPIKHVHAPGKCNKQMSSKLKEHLVSGGEEDENIDDVTIDIEEI